LKRAEKQAVKLIIAEYSPKVTKTFITWADAEDMMTVKMKEANRRPRTIQDYLLTLKVLKDLFPDTNGPTDISLIHAEEFKGRRLKLKIEPITVGEDLDTLSSIWKKWFIGQCKLPLTNYWSREVIERPTVDKKDARRLLQQEKIDFLGWLNKRWEGWRLPVLCLQVKALTGCRLMQLCSLRKEDLQEGRIVFPAEGTGNKKRKDRKAILPPELFAELEALSGPTFVFERFSQDLSQIHRRRGKMHLVATTKAFDPKRLANWLQDEKDRYLKENTGVRHFKLHNFRGTAISEAIEAGADYLEVSKGFAIHPETARQYYEKVDEVRISDGVLGLIQGQSFGNNPVTQRSETERNGPKPKVEEGKGGPTASSDSAMTSDGSS